MITNDYEFAHLWCAHQKTFWAFKIAFVHLINAKVNKNYWELFLEIYFHDVITFAKWQENKRFFYENFRK